MCEISCIMQTEGEDVKNKCTELRPKCVVLTSSDKPHPQMPQAPPPVFHSIYSTTCDLYKLHSASIIMNKKKKNKKYCLCIYLYSVEKSRSVCTTVDFALAIGTTAITIARLRLHDFRPLGSNEGTRLREGS